MSYDQELEEQNETSRASTQDEIDDSRKLISNFWVEEYRDDQNKRKFVRHGKDASSIWKNLRDAIGPTIRRVGHRVFVIADEQIRYLKKSSEMFGWCLSQGVTFDWGNGSDMISKEEFFLYLQNTADRYDFATHLPHYPSAENFFYTRSLEPKSTGRLEELLEFFSPATSYDRDLIKAALITPFWGEYFGNRPAFLVDGMDVPDDNKKGIGKSTITEVLQILCGDYIDLSSKMDGEEIKKRVLTSGDNRIIRFDNIKTNKLSSGAIESFITASKISGHLMYLGHCSIPNLFGYYLTFNDASLSKDMAQRCVVIKVKRPVYDSYWLVKLHTLINNHRDEILQDIGHYLTKETEDVTPITRFPIWERAVLAKCTDDLKAIQVMIKTAQNVVDDEDNLRDDIRDIVYERLCELLKNIDPAKTSLGINRRVVVQWCSGLFPKGATYRSVLKNIERNLPHAFLPNFKTYSGAQYFIWSHARYEASLSGEKSQHEPTGCHRVEIDGLNHRTFDWKFLNLVNQ